jgi:hypothetical protein
MALRRPVLLTALGFAVAALALTVVLVSSGSARTKAGGTHRHSVAGHLVGVGLPVYALPQGKSFGSEETGRISHLGRVSYHVEGTFAKNPSGRYDLDGFVTIVTRSGRALIGTYHGTTSTGERIATTVHLIGGSGRFADASGSWTGIDRNAQTPGKTFPNQSQVRLNGHISY